MRSMKHSIKREQSHARMSFVECENQRSLAEGESNVRATLKHMKQTFNLILTLAAMLTMAQTAGATTKIETRTATWYMDGGTSGSTTLQDDHTLVSGGMELKYVPASSDLDKIVLTNNDGRKQTSFNRSVKNAYIEFTNLEGTVKSVELTNFIFYDSGMQMYVGLNKDNTSTLLYLQGTANDYDFPSNDNYDFSNSVTFEGDLEVSSANPLRIIFSGSSSGEFCFNNGVIAITYEVEVEDTSDPGHTFSFSSTGNTLTATCNQTSQHHTCGLTSGKSTLVLTANDASYDSQRHNASLNLSNFMTETGITDISSLIKYTNKATSNVSMTAPASIGEYTVTATVTIGDSYNYNCTLTKDFSILAGYKVNNIYSQFSLSKSSALVGETMTITYTQKMDESLDGLTLKGATSGNNITYTDNHDGTYTFTMPAEDVNLSATITYPLNEDNITQSGDTYTIKNAEGWNYFCLRLEVDGDLNGFSGKTVMLGDNITVTTMAGSTDHPFKGTFDGDGHTLTFNYTADRTNCAPFRITDGVTIRNLHATGQIEGGEQHYLSGLVGSASGNLTIENCRVSTQISSTVSGIANNGGFVGLLSSHYNQCHFTGCVFDGLIYNPNYSGTTYGCGGFVGGFSQYGYAILKDCLFLHGQYDNNGNKCELDWGYANDRNSTFLHRSNDYGGGTLTNCFYVSTRGLKQGSPAVESATAPTNFAHFGTPTDHCFLKVYGHTMVFDGKYYTPPYGDLVETYDFSGVKSYNIEYDDAPLGIPDITTQLWVPLLRYKRTFTNGKPVTVMMPFNFTKSAFKKGGSSNGLTGHFYEFKGIRLDVNVSNKWVAVMKEVGSDDANEVTTMKANTPYLYVPDEEPQYWYIDNGGDGVTIFTEGYDGGNKVTPYDGSDGTYSWNKWNFKGTYQPRYWSDSENPEEIGKVYGFAGATKEVGEKPVVAGDFVRAKSGAKIRPTSCYLMWAGSEPSNARALTRSAAATEELPQSITVKLVGANGETTAIGTLDTKTGEMTFDSEAWYTLDGVRLSSKPSTKGIYINNGKKIVIK